MARLWRIQYEAAVYHIAARGNNRLEIFLDEADREYFLNLLARTSARFELRVLAFCHMSNHYHLVEECGLPLTKVAKIFDASVPVVSHTLKSAERTGALNLNWDVK